MFKILIIGSTSMILCLIIQGLFVLSLLRAIQHLQKNPWMHDTLIRKFFILVASMGVLMIGTLVQVGIWAELFMILDEFQNRSTAYYYSLVNFATLGYGDIVMSGDWRILGALEAINGVMMLGITTSLLYAIFNSLLIEQLKSLRRHDA